MADSGNDQGSSDEETQIKGGFQRGVDYHGPRTSSRDSSLGRQADEARLQASGHPWGGQRSVADDQLHTFCGSNYLELLTVEPSYFFFRFFF